MVKGSGGKVEKVEKVQAGRIIEEVENTGGGEVGTSDGCVDDDSIKAFSHRKVSNVILHSQGCTVRHKQEGEERDRTRLGRKRGQRAVQEAQAGGGGERQWHPLRHTSAAAQRGEIKRLVHREGVATLLQGCDLRRHQGLRAISSEIHAETKQKRQKHTN
jgi:hypothetical protein